MGTELGEEPVKQIEKKRKILIKTDNVNREKKKKERNKDLKIEMKIP